MVAEELKTYQETRKVVGKRRAVRIFFYHLAAYALGNIFLGAWNILTYQLRGDEILWFYSPLIFWGIGVIIHYLQGVALFDDWWNQDETITERLMAEKLTESSNETD